LLNKLLKKVGNREESNMDKARALAIYYNSADKVNSAEADAMEKTILDQCKGGEHSLEGSLLSRFRQMNKQKFSAHDGQHSSGGIIQGITSKVKSGSKGLFKNIMNSSENVRKTPNPKYFEGIILIF
jgi:hypothetical protein